MKNLYPILLLLALTLVACGKEAKSDIGPCVKCGTFTGTYSIEVTLPNSQPLNYNVQGEIFVTRNENNNYNLSFDLMPLLGDPNEILIVEISGPLQMDSLLLNPSNNTNTSGAVIGLEGGAKFSSNNSSISCNIDFSDDLSGNLEFAGSK